jgi:hypothetical protein
MRNGCKGGPPSNRLIRRDLDGRPRGPYTKLIVSVPYPVVTNACIELLGGEQTLSRLPARTKRFILDSKYIGSQHVSCITHN